MVLVEGINPAMGKHLEFPAVADLSGVVNMDVTRLYETTRCMANEESRTRLRRQALQGFPIAGLIPSTSAINWGFARG